MEKFIGQDIDDLKERELFIKDNADAVEDKGYSKPLPSATIDKLKETLASPEANDVIRTSVDAIIDGQIKDITKTKMTPGILVVEV